MHKRSCLETTEIYRYFKLFDFYHTLEAFAERELYDYPHLKEQVLSAAHILDDVRCELVKSYYEQHTKSPLGEIK